jgi:hypothetical protein
LYADKKFLISIKEDNDIAAAIEASLREMNNQSRSSPYTQQYSTNPNPNYSLTYTPYDYKSSNPVSSSAYELSTIEAENIYQFSELLERIQQNGGDLMRDRQVQVDIIILNKIFIHYIIYNL